MKEKDIISGCKNGNRLAQKYFVEQYSAFIFNICKRYIKREDVAKDCLQDILIHVLKKINKYSEQGRFKGWLTSVTVNKCIENIRREKKHLFAELDHTHDPVQHEIISTQLEHEQVMNFLETIPDQYRIVINMFLVEGYSHKEIGSTLGLSESSSRSILSRARKMINKAFHEEKIQVIYNSKKKIAN